MRSSGTIARAAACALSLLVLAGRGDGGDGPKYGTITTVPVPKGQAVRGAILRDLDGDGREDLVVSSRRAGRRGDARFLRVHLRRDGDPAFAAEPDAVWELDDAVTAFAAGDVDPAPGAEIVLFTASAVYAWKPRAPEGKQFARLLEASFLFQLPDPKEAFPFESAVADVDGDGLDDLVIPEPEGYRVAIQRRGEGGARFDAPSVLRVPEEAAESEAGDTIASRKLKARAAKKQIKIALTIGGDGGDQPSGDLLSIEERIPAPQLVDEDGDGRLDVLAQTGRQLHVWRQRADHKFPAEPDASLDLPVPADRTRRLDVSYSALTADLDGDRRTDCVLFAGDKNTDDVRTQVLVFTRKGGAAAAPLFPADGMPRQLLVIAGFAGAPRLLDVDGDGRKDLTAGSMRLDAMDAVAAAAKGTVDAELYVYRNQGGTFSRTPDLTLALTLKAEGLKRGREGLLARFVADVTGDGVRDLLLRDEPGRLRLHMVRRTSEGLTVVPQPLFETWVQETAKVRVRDRQGAPSEALILEDAQVRHVRWP